MKKESRLTFHEGLPWPGPSHNHLIHISQRMLCLRPIWFSTPPQRGHDSVACIVLFLTSLYPFCNGTWNHSCNALKSMWVMWKCFHLKLQGWGAPNQSIISILLSSLFNAEMGKDPCLYSTKTWIYHQNPGINMDLVLMTNFDPLNIAFSRDLLVKRTSFSLHFELDSITRQDVKSSG